MFATVEDALAYGAEFRKKLQAVLDNPEFRPPWVSGITSLYAFSDAENLDYYYSEAQKGTSPDERRLLDTAYAVRRAVLFNDAAPSDAHMDRLIKTIEQGGYWVAPKIRAEIEKIRESQNRDKPDLG